MLCAACNEGFSSLDAELEEQLREINGFLGVVPDHGSEPKLASTTDSLDGKRLGVDAEGRAVIAEPVTVSEATDPATGEQLVRVQFDNEKQVQQWISEQKAKGFKVKQRTRTEGVQYAAQRLKAEWSFGGPEALREIGRIALNFLAHHHPELARSPELREMKEFILGESTDQHVWWDMEEPCAALPDAQEKPYRFGHRIVISKDAQSGRVVGHVSFFSAFRFFVDFGVLQVDNTETIVVDIDPLAKAAPADLKVARHDEFLWPPDHQASGADYSGHLRDAMNSLVGRIYDFWWEKTERELLPALNGLRSLEPRVGARMILDSLEPHKQRILNLLTAALEFTARALEAESKGGEAEDAGKAIAEALLLLGSADADRSCGLSRQAESMLTWLTARIADGINTRLQDHELTGPELRSLLEGTDGQQVVASVLAEVLDRGTSRPGETCRP